MPKFTDATGRTWDVTITAGHFKPLREQCQVDLTALSRDPEAFIEKLLVDVSAIPGVLWELCRKQATGLGAAVAEADFLDQFDGPTLEAGTVAVWEAFADFFRFTPIGVRIRADGAAAVMRTVTDAIVAAIHASPEPAPAPAPAA